jgi:endonuclease/exonuclease/phosphatase family metal-dependent hydrolase
MRSFLLRLTVLSAAATHAQSITVIGFNVESGGASVPVLSQVIAKQQGVDVWGLSEVQDKSWLDAFVKAAAEGEGGAKFEGVLGTTGQADRLAVVYNSTRFELVRSLELHHINVSGTVRAPLVAHLRLRSAPQTEFLFMVNHLYRGDAEGRHRQARLLNDWGRQQALPVIATGDYNFDWNVNGGDTDHDPGYDFMTAGDVFKWVRFPSPMVKTQCSNFNSVLDFVFLAGPARQWKAESSVLFADDATYCDQSRNGSDHRPVLARLDATPGTGRPTPTTVTRQDILNRIAALENELRALRALAEKLP